MLGTASVLPGVKRRILCVGLLTGMVSCSEQPLRQLPRETTQQPQASAAGAELATNLPETVVPAQAVASQAVASQAAPTLPAGEPLPRGESFRRGIVLGPFGVIEKREVFRRTHARLLDQAAAIGATDLQILVRWSQLSPESIELAPLDTVDDELLYWLIEAAHQRKLRVMLTPTVGIENVPDVEVGAVLAPSDWERWWWSYSRLVLHCARVAVMRKVATVAVGNGLTSSEQHDVHWRKLITDARRIFKGEIAYVARATSFDQVGFWSDVDVVGIAVDPSEEAEGGARVAARIAASSVARERGYVIMEMGTIPHEADASLSQHRTLFDNFGDADRLRGLFVHDALIGRGKGTSKSARAATEAVRAWFSKDET